jgi:hypothetical protein
MHITLVQEAAVKDFEDLKIQASQENDVDAVIDTLWDIASRCCESSEYAKAIQELKDQSIDIVCWLYKYVYSRSKGMQPLFDDVVLARFAEMKPRFL